MAHRIISRFFALSMIMALSILLASNSAVGSAVSPATVQQTAPPVYLPIIANNHPAAPSIFGVAIQRQYVPAVAPRFGETMASWVRYGQVSWAEVEPTPGARNWSSLSAVDAELMTLARYGATTTVIIRGWPEWALKFPGVPCGPIKQEALDAFANFMRDLVARYSLPPYNVKYWEIGNEPDIDPQLVPVTEEFGCWGDQQDPYYGGGYYAEMLKRIYPAIKQADPSAKVIVGGLLLDCDPRNPPSGRDCKPSHFLEGILRGGGAQAFDIVAYHGYPLWLQGRIDWDLEFATWKASGGVVLGKANFLREVMQRYGVSKPLILNEGGLLCYNDDPICTTEFHAMQANYAVRLFTRAWANNLLSVQWYTLNGPGWWNGGLLDKNQSPRPAFETLKFLSKLLYQAEYVGTRSGNGYEGYAFRKRTKTYEIYWTNDSSTVQIPVPAGTKTVYDKLGQQLVFGSSLLVNYEPLIVEIE